MTPTLKRTVARGFTLIELLIVVIILAILAAIAIPQFSSSTTDAQLSALDSNLATVRSALEQYKVQHSNTYPGAVASTGTCPTANGTNAAGAIGTEAAMKAQLTNPTNAAGVACPIAGGDFRFGPYLRSGLPAEPIGNLNTVPVLTTTGAALTAGTAGGWAFDTLSGQFIMNNSGDDKSGKTPARKYSEH
jgi:prepilin-type N-terminal cleavage/methylation domain-containing protein